MFSQVMSVMKFSSTQEVIQRANSLRYGGIVVVGFCRATGVQNPCQSDSLFLGHYWWHRCSSWHAPIPACACPPASFQMGSSATSKATSDRGQDLQLEFLLETSTSSQPSIDPSSVVRRRMHGTSQVKAVMALELGIAARRPGYQIALRLWCRSTNFRQQKSVW